MTSDLKIGRLDKRLVLLIVAAPILVAAFSSAMQDEQALPAISRADMVVLADSLARFGWSPSSPDHLVASCEQDEAYTSDWELNQQIDGLPYDWGGMDGPDVFLSKLEDGQAAGSHSRHGSTTCTAGMDCSGYVGYLWGIRDPGKKKSTRTLYDIAIHPSYATTGNWFQQMKAGDALNKPGSHVVLFAGFRPDGNPIVYEANGSHGKVIKNDWSTWARYNGYEPIQYISVVED